jgi:hypothetical protein
MNHTCFSTKQDKVTDALPVSPTYLILSCPIISVNMAGLYSPRGYTGRMLKKPKPPWSLNSFGASRIIPAGSPRQLPRPLCALSQLTQSFNTFLRIPDHSLDCFGRTTVYSLYIGAPNVSNVIVLYRSHGAGNISFLRVTNSSICACHQSANTPKAFV